MAATRGDSRADYAIAAQIGQKLGLNLESQHASLAFLRLAGSLPQFAGLTYPRLSETTEQWPIIGRADLFYGGTSYDNHQGLGVQLPRASPDHGGDERNDLEEIVAGYYPCLEVGAGHAYNGTGYALGGKIIESMTGEALPQFFKRHLWAPLGCEHTDAIDGSAWTMSVPLDIAKFGQMLLNRGAYGKQRFFSEETFEKMLPVKLAPYVHFETEIEWGIGPVWTPEAGLSKRTFGHGAASGATLRIDPENDLVIVMTRNASGSQYAKYHPQFIQAIVESMAE